jgi:uncharacterized membrane-anchored protein
VKAERTREDWLIYYMMALLILAMVVLLAAVIWAGTKHPAPVLFGLITGLVLVSPVIYLTRKT